ncbi:MAG: FAD-dependent oxidoreductase [Fuerstiella sp.]|nr:FAD-dependent oxidoreductase [Fuerstiella sp.]MCP4853749.1 FAD-dependent oxidoreductase [Fuerstiella sp.]
MHPSGADNRDVIIVGGGGSGLAAGVSCVERGLSVLLLEKQPQLGGTTGIAVGSFTASGTRYQRRSNINDNAFDHNEDAGRFARPEDEAAGNRELREFFLGHAGGTLDWLETMGLRFHGPSPEPPNRVPRMHNVIPNARAYIAALQLRFVRLGGLIVTNASVQGLLRADGKVTGVTVDVNGTQRMEKCRRGVVLAAGDYAGNAQMIAEHKGDVFAAVEGINPNATGDGHRFAASVGGQLRNMAITYGPEFRFVPPPEKPFSQLVPSSPAAVKLMGTLLPLVPKFLINAFIKRLLVTWQHPEDALLEDGAILINRHGRRFCDELTSPNREIAVANQPDKVAWILLDETIIKRYSQWPHFISTAPEIAYAYVNDYLRLRPDVAIQSHSLEQLAARRNLPAAELVATAGGTRNVDGVPKMQSSLAGNRWVLLGPVKSYFTTTEGGAVIDTSFRVLDRNGEIISGLYAIGQNGLGGQILWSHGLHIAWAITSGRLVGEVLAENNP